MQPGGTRQTILVAAAIAASVVLAAWWWSSSSAQRSDAANASAKAKRVEVVDRGIETVARQPVVLPQAALESTPAPAEATASSTEQTKSTPPAAAVNSSNASAPSSDPNTAVESDANSAEPTAVTAEETESDAPNPDAKKSEASEKKADDVPAAETAGHPAPGSAVDAERAADQFAQLFELTAAGEVHEALRKDLTEFEARDRGDDAERELEQSLRMHVDGWIAALPPNLAPHVLLVSAECRLAACRLLIAQTDVVFSGEMVSLNAMRAAEPSLLDPTWLESLGLRYLGYSMHPNGGGPPDTALWLLQFAAAEK